MSSMYFFTPKRGRSNLSRFTDCTKHASAGALIHRQQTIHWIFIQTKLSSNYSHKPIVTYWALKKRLALLTIQEKPKLAIIFCLLFGREDSAEILASVWQVEKNFEVLKRSYIQIFPTSVQLCYGKAVNLLHTCNLEWSNVKFL